jgi:hypothetical protein
MLFLLLSSALASPPTLCVDDETPWFSCSVKGGKTVSLCSHTDGLAYRFGAPGAVELVVPAEGHDLTSFEASKASTGPDSARHVFSVHNDGYRYAIRVDRTEDQFDAALTVHKGSSPVVTLACSELGPVDLTTDLEPLYGTGGEPEAWVGAWSGGGGRFVIEAQGDALRLVDGHAEWHGGPDRVHTGEAAGDLTRTGPSEHELKSEACQITLNRTGPDVIDVEDNNRCGGMNVTFTGQYRRAPDAPAAP